ncbi:hypothetical protein D1007_52878 [Hordeum vulgare]|nr:hypothetical protein D1007_52878 [Hordeum vulgare]
MSQIQRDRQPLQEVKGFLKHHTQLKESMKFYFLLPRKELINGWAFLNHGSCCVKMVDYICVGGVADIDHVVEPAESNTDVLIPDETGVITQRLCSPMKQRRSSIGQVVEHVEKDNLDSDSDSDSEYIGQTYDSGEDSEVVELSRHVMKFKNRMRDTKSWIRGDATGPVPTDLIANLEEQIEREEMDWNYDSYDEDYNYVEDSNGHIRNRKTTFPRYNTESEVPHFVSVTQY